MPFNPWTGTTGGGGGISPYIPAMGVSIGTLPGLWAAGTGSNVPAQEFIATLATAAVSTTINHMATWIGGAAATAGAGVNGLAIYSAAGTLLAQTGDMTAAFQATGYQQGTLGSGVAIVAGTNYYLCFLHNFTGTAPTIPGYVPPPGNTPTVHGNVLHGFLNTQATFPASFSPGGLGSGQHWFYTDGSP